MNNLLKNWHGRIKFVDDTAAFEIIPRGSPSILPMVVHEISNFASINNTRQVKSSMAWRRPGSSESGGGEGGGNLAAKA